MKNEKIIVGMSGGVDSSVAALLLQQQGYDIEGVFMKNWEADDDDEYCSATEDAADAQTVCDKLNIPLHTVNFSETYWDKVFDIFLEEFRKGRTPNPDILCNKEIKFKAFLDYAKTLGASKIATGHYARCIEKDGHYELLKGLDLQKDQTYFLYTLGQHPLSQAIFPLGAMEKTEIRQIAEKAGFINHDKKDSTGICFIGERKFKTFLSQYLPAKKGLIKTIDGTTLGKHDGLMYYTLGQRKGLGIGGQKDAPEAAWYVLEKDLKHNVLIVGQEGDHPLLYSKTLTFDDPHWVADQAPIFPLNCQAKIRYRQADQACIVDVIGEKQYKVSFREAQRAIAPGQSIVLYFEDQCLGGGIIN